MRFALGAVEARLGRRLEVAVADAVHFCGFRYGRGEFNPYETYQVEIARGSSVRAARRRFTDFLVHYRPRHLGEALGVELSRDYPLWQFPWLPRAARGPVPGAWREEPDECPDILTHFSEAGIRTFRIDEEFVWLERALRRIGGEGYRPGRHGHAVVVELRPRAGASSFLLHDGNHRVGAMSALGQTRFVARRSFRSTVCEDRSERWPAVRSGLFTSEDALRVFRAFFMGERPRSTSGAPAPLLGPTAWKELYS